jgi:hypothetical protein
MVRFSNGIAVANAAMEDASAEDTAHTSATRLAEKTKCAIGAKVPATPSLSDCPVCPYYSPSKSSFEEERDCEFARFCDKTSDFKDIFKNGAATQCLLMSGVVIKQVGKDEGVINELDSGDCWRKEAAD